MKKSYTLLTPGPVPLTEPIQQILSQQPSYHRDGEFQHIFKEVQKNLQIFFQTQESVLILTSTGTGAMEAAITNTLSPEDLILCVCSGKFGLRWKHIALSHKLKVDVIEVPWGEAVSPEQISKHLKQNPNIKAVLVSACETSTATNHPIKDISQVLCDKPDVLFMVDGITGLGSMPLPMDEWNIDVLVGGSQKSFLLPTGLSFIALSKKAWEFEKHSQCPKFYFHLKREKRDQDKGYSSFSINVSFIEALKESLNQILKQPKGLEQTITRCQTLAKATQMFCKDMHLSLLSKSPSSAVTAIEMPEDISALQVKQSIKDKAHIIVAGGQDHLKDKIIRIGHLGYIQNKDLLMCLKVLGEELHLKNPNQFPKYKIQHALQTTKKILTQN